MGETAGAGSAIWSLSRSNGAAAGFAFGAGDADGVGVDEAVGVGDGRAAASNVLIRRLRRHLDARWINHKGTKPSKNAPITRTGNFVSIRISSQISTDVGDQLLTAKTTNMTANMTQKSVLINCIRHPYLRIFIYITRKCDQ